MMFCFRALDSFAIDQLDFPLESIRANSVAYVDRLSKNMYLPKIDRRMTSEKSSTFSRNIEIFLYICMVIIPIYTQPTTPPFTHTQTHAHTI